MPATRQGRVLSRFAFSSPYSGGAARAEIKVPSGEWQLDCIRTLAQSPVGNAESTDGVISQGVNRDGNDLSFTFNEPVFQNHIAVQDWPHIVVDDQDTIFGKISGATATAKFLTLYVRMVKLQ